MNSAPRVKNSNPELEKSQENQFDLLADSKSDLYRISRWLPSCAGGWRWLSTMVQLLWQGCGQELYSLLFRIRFQYRLATMHGAFGIGPLVEKDRTGVLVPCRRSLACIEGIQNFSVSHPWATDYDRTLFRDAWMSGVRWGERTLDCGIEERTSQACEPPEVNSIAESILDKPMQPWVSSPYSLISWWDMERFSAETFQHIASALTSFGQVENGIPLDIEAGELAVKLIPAMTTIRNDCEKLGLRVSVICIDEYIANADVMNIGMMTGSLQALNDTIRREMQACVFFHMPPNQVAYYDQRQPFGARVAVRFSSCEFDITEAGNCYAMGRGTACVFHLMRVMEVGVQWFGDKLGVPLVAEKNWQVILDQVNKAIKLLPAKDARSVSHSQIAAHLYNVKLAWRNQVMHPHDKYTIEEAKDIYLHVQAFMKALSDLGCIDN